MPKNDPLTPTKDPNLVMVFVMCAVVGAGIVLAAFQAVLHAPEYICAYFTHVDHPIKPNFDKSDALLAQVCKRNRVD